MSELDAVVIGSGPNGLSAAIELARQGASVLVLEGKDELGGGMRTAELTQPGFLHDVCSAAHPMGVLSPFMRSLPLEEHGLTWCIPPASFAQPLGDGPALLHYPSVDATAEQLGADAARYRKLVAPFADRVPELLEDALGPIPFLPKHPLLLARFGLVALRSSKGLAGRFRTPLARAMVAGCAAHSILPLNALGTAAVAMMFLLIGHARVWPVVQGGTIGLAQALASYLRSLGGRIETGHWVNGPGDLPPARVYLFDTSPNQLAKIAGDALPARYVRRLGRYRYGPGAFKLDWALDGPIPWRDPRCREASTVHLGGTFEQCAAGEAAVWRGEHPEQPYVLLCQQSEADPTRAPEGKHTGYAYVHVPAGSTVDMTEAIEAQVERFAPGFRDLILARHATGPAAFEAHNPNYVGGAITGGVADLAQLFFRPVARLDPYSTPNPKVWICSAATPPGPGVHGMGGYHAAKRAARRLDRLSPEGL